MTERRGEERKNEREDIERGRGKNEKETPKLSRSLRV